MDPVTGQALFCTVRLSRPLLNYRTLENLQETLLHEMIHAWLFLTKSRHSRDDGVDGHGPDFIEKMIEINATTGLRLSVYHQFDDEVDRCREHVWLCDGKVCTKKPPYYGAIKRSKNLPPGPNDWWFALHKKDCGGSFIKVLEPAIFNESGKSQEEFKVSKAANKENADPKDP
jgi:predicted SprT family Zn-dependent metalloprotease